MYFKRFLGTKYKSSLAQHCESNICPPPKKKKLLGELVASSVFLFPSYTPPQLTENPAAAPRYLASLWAWPLSAFLQLSPSTLGAGLGEAETAIWSSSTCLLPMGRPNRGKTTKNQPSSLCPKPLPLETLCLSFPLPSQEPGTGPQDTSLRNTPEMHGVLRILQVWWIPGAYTSRWTLFEKKHERF